MMKKKSVKIVIVGYYFESKRALATGIAVCGSGVGSIILPLLSNFILNYFERDRN